MHRPLHPLGHVRLGNVLDGAAGLEHRPRLEGLEVVEHDEIGLVAGRDRAEVVEAVPRCRVQRGEDERVLRRDARGDGLPHHLVQVTGVGDVLRVAVVRAERHARGAELLHERQEVLEVPRHRRLADEQPHAGAEPLSSLLDGQRLVVRADTRRRRTR